MGALERASGEGHVFANAILSIAMAVLHLGTIASIVLNVWFDFHRHGAFSTAEAERVGRLVAWAVSLVWALAGLVWAPMNAWGLSKKRPWARTSTLVYWGFASILCCCLPGGGYGIWSLLRPDVRALFPPRSGNLFFGRAAS
jgi:hypothetical protein